METEEPRWFGHILDKSFKHLRIVIISDPHYGNPLFSEKHFTRTIDFVKNNPDVYCILNGDLCESSLRTSKGDIYKQVGTPQDQRDWIIEKLTPLHDRILGMTSGNHEMRIYNEAGMDISKDIAAAFHVPYRQEGIFLKIMFGDGNDSVEGRPYVFWAYCTHGYGGARTKSAKAVKAERVAAWVHTDFIAMAHDHVVNVSPDVYLIPDNRGTVDTKTGFLTGKLTAHRKMLIKTNAYLKWGGYSEMGGFPPVDLATPVVMLLTPESEYWKLIPERPQKAVKVIV